LACRAENCLGDELDIDEPLDYFLFKIWFEVVPRRWCLLLFGIRILLSLLLRSACFYWNCTDTHLIGARPRYATTRSYGMSLKPASVRQEDGRAGLVYRLRRKVIIYVGARRMQVRLMHRLAREQKRVQPSSSIEALLLSRCAAFNLYCRLLVVLWFIR